jgi:20S proteasome alpha/beta subunit
MTYVVALVACDGIVIASDGREADPRTGEILCDRKEKVIPLGRCSAIGFAGTGDLVEQVKRELNVMRIDHESRSEQSAIRGPRRYVNEFIGPSENAPGILFQAAEKMFKGDKENFPDVVFVLDMLVAGYEKGVDGVKPAIYTHHLSSTPNFPTAPKWLPYPQGRASIGSWPRLPVPYPAVQEGMGTVYNTFLDQLHKREDKVEDVIPVALYLVVSAMSRNIYVGGQIRVFIIRRPADDRADCYEERSRDDVLKIIQHNKVFRIDEYLAWRPVLLRSDIPVP